MIREQEIEKEAKRVSYNGDEFTSFIQGAEWADETMLKKARKWIKENFKNYIGADEFADDFCKAMEE